MMLVIVIIVLLVYYFYKKTIAATSHWQNIGVKCWKPVFLFGDLWTATTGKESTPHVLLRQYNDFKNERFYGGYKMLTPILYIRDPDLIKQITIKDFDYFTDHNPIILSSSLFKKSLFSLKGEDWRVMRSNLSPAFTSSKMKMMFQPMMKCAVTLVDYFSYNCSEMQEVELKDAFTRYTNDVIAVCAFGVKCDSFNQKENEFFKMGKDMTDLSGLKTGLKLALALFCPFIIKVLRISFKPPYLLNYFKDLVADVITTRQSNNIVHPDMLHLLIEIKNGQLSQEEPNLIKESEKHLNRKEITLEDIQAQALVFFFAGFDTVSRLLSFLGYELAINNQVQERLRVEIRETLSKCNGLLTYEALNSMKYLDMVISEALRKWPTAITGDRICTKPYVLSTATNEPVLKLFPGDQIQIPLFAMHRDPDFFPNPDTFDPERFSDENRGKMKLYSYIPFGIGPRTCIGSRFALTEMKVIIVHLLNKFQLHKVAKTEVPLKLKITSPTIDAENGFWVGFKLLPK